MAQLSNDDDSDPGNDAEDRKSFLRSTPALAWGLGIVVPLALIAYGLFALQTQSAAFVGRTQGLLYSRWSIVSFHGTPAIGLGAAYIGLGVFLHFHGFWSWRERCDLLAQIGMSLALLAVAIGGFYFAIHAIAGC